MTKTSLDHLITKRALRDCGAGWRGAASVASMTKDEGSGTPWWDFVAYRRRYVSDRVWFGLALVAGGCGSLGAAHGWTKLLAGLALIVGVLLIGTGVMRAVRRSQPVPGAAQLGNEAGNETAGRARDGAAGTGSSEQGDGR